MNPENTSTPTLRYRGTPLAALVPVAIFLAACVYYFIITKAFEMHALAMGALIGLLLGSLFVRSECYNAYWAAACDGAREAVPIALLLLIIGTFAAMIKAAGLSEGFVWLARRLDVDGRAFTAFTFVAVCIIATATGSSIGTIFTCFPIFYPAGTALACAPAPLAAAIVCGGIFGDNLAPISDTTIISAGTQHYSRRPGAADIGGCVATRLKYAIIGGAVAVALYWHAGGTGAAPTVAVDATPAPLIMLIPVVLMLTVAVKTRDIYKAIAAGLITGTVLGLVSGVITPAQVISVHNGSPAGYLTDGVASIATTAVLVLGVYAIMGVLSAAGVLHSIAEAVSHSAAGRSSCGAELAMMAGTVLTTLIFGGVTSASMATFGKIQDEIGSRAGLHPYRRANLLDGFANSIPLAVPFLSVFILIGSTLAAGYPDAVTPAQIAGHMYYCYALFVVLLVSVLTGWGRIYEGEGGAPVRKKP